jgi:hypothetical protein
MERSTKRKLLWAAVALSALVVVVGVTGWYYLLREVHTHFDSEEENFKYGSAGAEAASGVPYWVWYVLPQVFADHMPAPGGYQAFGLVWEDGREAPVGMPVTTVGFRRLGVNCALCHVGTVRTDRAAKPQLVLGAPSSRFDLQAYLRFLYACAGDPRFTADHILPEIEKVHKLPFVESLLYRLLVIPQMKKALLKQQETLAWMDKAPTAGPGRTDAFNPAKTEILKLPPDGSIGASDISPLWNFERRHGFGLHWDGLNTSDREILLNSGIGIGASNKTIDKPNLDRMFTWFSKLPAAKYPVDRIDAGKAEQGQVLFKQQCALCHAFNEKRTGTPIPIDELGTDRHRLDAWSQKAADAFNGLTVYSWKYEHFRKTDGYAAVPLDGIWARAPYLHNGSVPTLRDLLEAPEARPATFYRGYDVFDPERVGFVSSVAGEGTEKFFKFDTKVPGNGNGGHLWGTQLSPPEKDALVEYMKML